MHFRFIMSFIHIFYIPRVYIPQKKHNNILTKYSIETNTEKIISTIIRNKKSAYRLYLYFIKNFRPPNLVNVLSYKHNLWAYKYPTIINVYACLPLEHIKFKIYPGLPIIDKYFNNLIGALHTKSIYKFKLYSFPNREAIEKAYTPNTIS